MYYCYPVQETKLQAKGQETVKMIRKSSIGMYLSIYNLKFINHLLLSVLFALSLLLVLLKQTKSFSKAML